MKTHKDLILYQEALNFVEEIYLITQKFPDTEKYSLSNQMRRACISLPSNISEGAIRDSTKEFIRFLYIALGSLSELETQLEIAFRLKYINQISKTQDKIIYLRRMLLNLIRSLKKQI